MKSILFVCTGNTCRSSMAEILFKEIVKNNETLASMEIKSAGILASDGQPASHQALQVMKEKGLRLENHRSRQIKPEMIENADLVLTMTKRHKEAILSICPQHSHKVFTLKEYVGSDGDIMDPYGQSIDVYRSSCDEIEGYLKRAAKRIKDL